MSPTRFFLPFLTGVILLSAPIEEKLRKRAESLAPGTAISLVMLKGNEIRGQMVVAGPQGVKLTTFRDNRIVQVEVPYREMSGIRVRGHSAGGRVLNGFAYFGGFVLLFALFVTAATGGRAIIALTVMSATLLVQAQDLSRVKRRAVDAQLGGPVEVVRLNGEKFRGYLLAVSDEGVKVRQGGAPPRTIRFEEMKDIRDKRPAHWARNLFAGFGICYSALMVAVVLELTASGN